MAKLEVKPGDRVMWRGFAEPADGMLFPAMIVRENLLTYTVTEPDGRRFRIRKGRVIERLG